MHDEDIVCTCMSVSVRDIKTAIEAGASSFQEVQDATGAGTVCGACNDVLESVVEKQVKSICFSFSSFVCLVIKYLNSS